MKAIVFREFGPPQVLRLEEVPEPVPGPGEVLLNVRAVSVNRTLDLVVRAGQYAHRPVLPHVLGVDPCGVVAEIGQLIGRLFVLVHFGPKQLLKLAQLAGA